MWEPKAFVTGRRLFNLSVELRLSLTKKKQGMYFLPVFAIFCGQVQRVKKLHILSFSEIHTRLFKIFQTFLHILNDIVKGFSKYIF